MWDLLKKFGSWLWDMFVLLIDWITVPAESLVNAFAEAFPDTAIVSDLGQLNSYMPQVANWIDIDGIVQLFVTYGIWLVAITAYRVIKSWIPTLGAT